MSTCRQAALLGRRTFFDFTSQALPSGATLTRSSSATYTNSSGVIATAANDVARLDFDPVALSFRGLLYEPAHTNVIFPSQGATGYAANAGSITTGQSDPFGTSNAVLITANGTSNPHYFTKASGTVSYAAAEYAWSVLIKPTGGMSRIQIIPGSGGLGSAYCNFNFSNLGGSVGSGGGISNGTIEALAGGWYRLSMVGTTAALSGQSGLYTATITSDADGRTPTNTSADAWYQTGEQAEATSASNHGASSYIATTSGVATRAADALVLDWASRGVADGTITARYTFDDGSTQDVSTTVSGGTSTIPTTLNRSRLLRIIRL